MEQLGGAQGRPVMVHDTPLAVAPPYPITVSKASKLTYNDHGISHHGKAVMDKLTICIEMVLTSKKREAESDTTNGLSCRPF